MSCNVLLYFVSSKFEGIFFHRNLISSKLKQQDLKQKNR